MNYISLFSSAGVGCYGFKQAGYDCVATCELIERRLDVQKANNKVENENGYILGDITKKETKDKLLSAIDTYKDTKYVKDIDVIIFTAPCQGMSVANHKKNDGTIDKNSLVVEALELVKEIKPKFFIAENVRAFMNTKCIDHNEEKKISKAFDDYLSDEYIYETRVLNFKEYGAYSSRTRTLVIGVRKELEMSINLTDLFPNRQKEITLGEAIGHLPSLDIMGESHEDDIYHNFKTYRPDMREWITGVPEGKSAFDNVDPKRRPHKVVDGKIVPNAKKNADKYTRQRWDKVAPCIHTRNDIMSSQSTVHPKDDRVFSIRELMILMNVPKEFKWTVDEESDLNLLPKKERQEFLKKNEINIRQSLGEAIPTIIINEIALNIKEALSELN